MARNVRVFKYPEESKLKPTLSSPKKEVMKASVDSMSVGSVGASSIGASSIHVMKTARGMILQDDFCSDSEVKTSHTQVFGRANDWNRAIEDVKPFLPNDYFIKDSELEFLADSETASISMSLIDIESKSVHSETLSVASPLGDSVGFNIEKIDFAKGFSKYSIYTSFLVFNERNHVLLTKKGHLPSFEIYHDQNESGDDILDDIGKGVDIFIWAKTTSQELEPKAEKALNSDELMTRINNLNEPDQRKSRFKRGYLRSLASFLGNLSFSNTGYLYEKTLRVAKGKSFVLLHLIRMEGKEASKSLKWSPIANLDKSIFLKEDSNEVLGSFFRDYSRMAAALKPGLFVVLLQIVNSLDGLKILVQKHYKTLPPLLKIQESTEISSRDSALLNKFKDGGHVEVFDSPLMTVLFNSLDKMYESTKLKNFKLFSNVAFQMEGQISFLVMANINHMTDGALVYNTDLFELIPLHLFETIHFEKYLTRAFVSHRETSRGLNQALILQNELKTVVPFSIDIATQIKELKKDWNAKKWTRKVLETYIKS